MNGFDVQSAAEVARGLRAIVRRAETFGHDRERILEELIFSAENFEAISERIAEDQYKEFCDAA